MKTCCAIVKMLFTVQYITNPAGKGAKIIVKNNGKNIKIFAFFPLFLTVILAPFPSGLVIYWTVNNVLTMAQQVFIMKRTTVKTTV